MIKLMRHLKSYKLMATECFQEVKKTWKETPTDKQMIKSAIIVLLIVFSPVLFFMLIALAFAIIRFIPGWLVVAVIAGIAVLKKIMSKKKTSKKYSNIIYVDMEPES